jgi:hypothetical protein
MATAAVRPPSALWPLPPSTRESDSGGC